MEQMIAFRGSNGGKVHAKKVRHGTMLTVMSDSKTYQTCITLDSQQLGELGALLLFLSANSGGLDADSVDSLLDGYGVSQDSPQMQMFQTTLNEIAEAIDPEEPDPHAHRAFV